MDAAFVAAEQQTQPRTVSSAKHRVHVNPATASTSQTTSQRCSTN
jgi:hypothetical protein